MRRSSAQTRSRRHAPAGDHRRGSRARRGGRRARAAADAVLRPRMPRPQHAAHSVRRSVVARLSGDLARLEWATAFGVRRRGRAGRAGRARTGAAGVRGRCSAACARPGAARRVQRLAFGGERDVGPACAMETGSRSLTAVRSHQGGPGGDPRRWTAPRRFDEALQAGSAAAGWRPGRRSRRPIRCASGGGAGRACSRRCTSEPDARRGGRRPGVTEPVDPVSAASRARVSRRARDRAGRP